MEEPINVCFYTRGGGVRRSQAGVADKLAQESDVVLETKNNKQIKNDI